MAKWYSDGGDDKLRYNIKVDDINNVVVFDLGAYHGEFVEKLMKKYSGTYYLFDTNEEMVSFMKGKFDKMPNIHVNNYGLGKNALRGYKDGTGPGASIRIDPSAPELIKIFTEYYKSLNIDTIDILKVNIEGAEYDLIEHLVETGVIDKIKTLQVQFHDFVEDPLDKLLKMHRLLSRTHNLEFSYPFVWDQWVKKR
jgi:FkbM family methyltransferase